MGDEEYFQDDEAEVSGISANPKEARKQLLYSKDYGRKQAAEDFEKAQNRETDEGQILMNNRLQTYTNLILSGKGNDLQRSVAKGYVERVIAEYLERPKKLTPIVAEHLYRLYRAGQIPEEDAVPALLQAAGRAPESAAQHIHRRVGVKKRNGLEAEIMKMAAGIFTMVFAIMIVAMFKFSSGVGAVIGVTNSSSKVILGCVAFIVAVVGLEIFIKGKKSH